MWVWMEQLLQDVRYALRSLSLNPGFATAVVLTLAIAIGMNTAIFSVFNAVVLRPLAYPHPDRLVWLATTGAEGEPGIVAGPDFADWREHATSFERMAAYVSADVTLTYAHEATRARAAMVTHDFWDLSGARPAAGRLPQSGEDGIVILSQGFAQRWFAGDPDLIGRTMTLDGRQVAIAGIVPEELRFHLPGSPMTGFRPRDVDVYQPMAVSSDRSGPMQLLNVVGRLKPGVTLEQAQTEVEVIRRRTAAAFPHALNDPRTLRAVPLHDQLIGGARQALLVLLGAVAFVLLIGCANAANLLLARASARHREIAIRLSVGAGRPRVLRQLFVESLVLAVLGCAAGLVLAGLGIATIVNIDPYAIPRLAETSFDGRVLAVTLGTSVLTACAFGLAPALTVARMKPHDALKRGSMASPGVTTVRTRRIVVAGEVALALVLLIGAGLMLKSAYRMSDYTSGFEPERVLTAKFEFTGPQYDEPLRQIAFVDTLLGRVRTVPGVEAATISTHGNSLTMALIVEGEPKPRPDDFARKAPIMINLTSAALEQVMGFRLVRGRWFAEGEPAAVLNETLVRRDFAGRDPIGRRLQISKTGPMMTIVGIVADQKYTQLDAPAEPEVYVPYSRDREGIFGFTVLVLTKSNPLALAPSLRTLVADIDNTQVPVDLMSLERALADSIAPRRLNLFLLSTFAAAALFLAMVGIYGVMAYSVAERAHEIGIRMALGARQTDVVGMVVRQGMRMTLFGTLVGVIAALTLTSLMESLLYEVQPTDPLTFAVVTVALVTTALLACCIPAFRAALIDPVTSLRHE